MAKYLLLTLLLGCATIDCKKEKDKCKEQQERLIELISIRR